MTLICFNQQDKQGKRERKMPLMFKPLAIVEIMYKHLFFSVISFCVLVSTSVNAEERLNIVVKGLFTDNAIVIVDGKQRFLKKGKTSPEGITLLSADSKQAKIRYKDKVRTLSLSKDIGSSYVEPTVKEVRLQRGRNGHYFSPGTINGRQTNFLVDTGASTVALSSTDAEGLSLDYKSGSKVRVNTASGVSDAYQITLREVAIGGLSVNNVRAVVIEGNYPLQILLGNSFLSEVEMEVDQGVLVLQKNL